jgi:type I restriction enzyme R subunit
LTPESEQQTRRKRIDRQLTSPLAGWKIVSYTSNLDLSQLDGVAVEEYPTDSGPADYALFVKGWLLGFIEAKKLAVGAQNVLEQAKRYSRTASDGPGSWGEYHVPFLYSSNGEKIYFIDVRLEEAYSRELTHFHSPTALIEMFEQNYDFSWFKEHPIENPRLHDFQRLAVEKTEGALAGGRRSMLIAMATGTGKTFTTVSQIYRLLESKQYRRVLFLVDRRALAVQAVREFASFATPKGNKFNQEYEVYHQRFKREDYDDDRAFDPKILPDAYLTNPDASKTFVYVSTIQRMTINLFGKDVYEHSRDGDEESEDDAGTLDIPIHAFDLIIADECHRGYTATETGVWRDVLNHFDAVKIGLTATPAAHTMAMFKHVVYRYTTEEAITDGYLVDYEAVKISSNVRMNGAFLKQGELVGLIDTEDGAEKLYNLEDERDFPSTEIEKKITAPDSNRKIIQEIAKHAHDHKEECGHFPKTLIFAQNDLPHTSHADQLVQICREVFGQGDDFVQKITGNPNVDRPLQRIREFRNRPKPGVVVTVDMLSTGVDIPAIEFIVFLRPVKSRILWVQMLGRGTRKCQEINKEKFVVFDCFGGTLFEYFKNSTDFNIEPPRSKPLSNKEVIENIYQNTDRDYHVKVLVKRLRRIERTMSGEAREMFSRFIPDGDVKAFADKLTDLITNDFTKTMELLRDKAFQDLLEDYPRAKRTFTVGYEVEDEVSSEAMIHAGPDYQKPEDYLVSFTRFVKENPEHIEAITVLLKRPSEWRTDLLDDLRRKLSLNNFPEKELQKAHNLVHHKALADIISMIKHAAAEEGLLSAEERIDRALEQVTAGKNFSEEQQKWLGFIREHLITNLTIDLADLDEAPVFEQRGGLRKAQAVFGEDLEQLLLSFNAAVAA